MKRVLSTVLLMSVITTALSQVVSVDIAERVALNFMRQHTRADNQVVRNDSIVRNDTTCIYRFILQDGAWCLVSPDYRCSPILAYGFSDSIFVDTPAAFEDIINNYCSQITKLSSLPSVKSNGGWGELLAATKAVPQPYFSSTRLLDNTIRGDLRWKQQKSNDNSCVHPYNKYCPSGLEFLGCDCGHAPVGCGAVALGMTMWYWQWPRSHHWELYPRELTDNTPDEQADSLALFLRYCGEITEMTYVCTGSWTIMDNVVDALHDEGYESATKYKTNDWWPWAWRCLISSEIDNGRPIIYYGQSGSVSFWTGHYFVVDGYDNSTDRKFHVNFGHGRPDYNSWFKLDNIYEIANEDTSNYTHYNHAIVGISPTVNDMDIYHLPYEEIEDSMWRTEYAYREILLPREREELTVYGGGSLYLEAGKEIILRPGFTAKRGSDVTAHINMGLYDHMEIGLFIPTSNVVSGGFFQIETTNADSWEFTVKRSVSSKVYQGAGIISGNNTVLWNPISIEAGVYRAELVLKNSYGRKKEYSFSIHVIDDDNILSYQESTDTVETETFLMTNANLSNSNHDSLYPNPTDGQVTVVADATIEAIVVYTTDGRPVGGWKLLSLSDNRATLDVSPLPDGLYLLSLRTMGGTATHKLYKMKQ